MSTTERYQTRNRVRKFTQAGALLSARVRGVSGKRGFAEARLLTRWAEICGPDLAAIARPAKVAYGRSGFGATLILACDGARAAEVMMQADQIRTRVNACYGYNAIARVQIRQEDAQGFAERQAQFTGVGADNDTPSTPPPAARERAAAEVSGVTDPGLADALTALGVNVLARKAVKSPD